MLRKLCSVISAIDLRIDEFTKKGNYMKNSRIAIIGTGAVGSVTAYALMLSNVSADILLVDTNVTRCKGELFDLEDALPFSLLSSIKQATMAEAAESDIIIIAAGARQSIGQTRRDLNDINQKIITEIISDLHPLNPQALLIVVSNPVDILTKLVQDVTQLPRHQVFGSGTLLDTLRLRSFIKEKIAVSEQSINVFVLGEHGDTQFPVWSSATIAGIPITQFPGLNQRILDQCAEHAKQKVYEIIACKQATYFGVASCVATMCTILLHDQRSILPVSTYIPEFDVCLSVPVILGAKGIEALDVHLNDKEQEQLALCAKTIKSL